MGSHMVKEWYKVGMDKSKFTKDRRMLDVRITYMKPTMNICVVAEYKSFKRVYSGVIFI